MTSLYRRPTPFGTALLRAIEGSVRAAFHDHPEWGISDKNRTARSIAKRATGTIAADWPRLSAIAADAGMVARAGVSDTNTPDTACGAFGRKRATRGSSNPAPHGPE
jgi:hypothetical protein